jgi:tRNA(Ile)-lysidine synthase
LAIQRRLIKKALIHIGLEGQLTFRHIETICRLVSGGLSSGEIQLPMGRRVRLVYDKIHFLTGVEEAPCAFVYQLTVPGSIEIVEIQQKFVVSINDATFNQNNSIINQAVFDMDVLVFPLFVRSRRNGDFINPHAFQGRKKIKKILIDKKIPRHFRNRIPLIEDGLGRIIWVAGIIRSNLAPITEKTQNILSIYGVSL